MSTPPNEQLSLYEPGPLVLVVDDELTPRAIVTRMVRGFGHRVQSCASAREALSWLEEHPREARVLLADLLMPRMDGGELAERALDLDPGLHVVLMVDWGVAAAADLLEGYPEFPRVAKPVTFSALYDVLTPLLAAAPRRPRYPRPIGRISRTRLRRRESGQHREG